MSELAKEAINGTSDIVASSCFSYPSTKWTTGWTNIATFDVSGYNYTKFSCHAYDPVGNVFNQIIAELDTIFENQSPLGTNYYTYYRIILSGGALFLQRKANSTNSRSQVVGAFQIW